MLSCDFQSLSWQFLLNAAAKDVAFLREYNSCLTALPPKCRRAMTSKIQKMQQSNLSSTDVVSSFITKTNTFFQKHRACVRKEIIEMSELCFATNDVESNCRNRKIKVVASRYLNVTSLRTLLTMNPDLFLMYYVALPLAVADWLGPQMFNKTTLAVCKAMEADIEAFLDLNDEFPGALKVIRHEDLIQAPGSTLMEVYDLFDEAAFFEGKRWLRGQVSQEEGFLTAWKRHKPIHLQPSCRKVMQYLRYDLSEFTSSK
jgi:hypothetical protein